MEVEVLYSGRFSAGTRKDIDNILKPTLDALNGVAYVDDKQVRSVTATLFAKNERIRIQGYAQYFGPQRRYSYQKHKFFRGQRKHAAPQYAGFPETLDGIRLGFLITGVSIKPGNWTENHLYRIGRNPPSDRVEE